MQNVSDNNISIGQENLEKIIKNVERRANAKRAGHLGAIISSILAIISIFALGIIFLPIAIIIAIFSTLNAIANVNISGILYNLLAWILIAIGASQSIAFLGLMLALGFQFNFSDKIHVSTNNINTKTDATYNYNEASDIAVKEKKIDEYKGLSLGNTIFKSCKEGGTICHQRGRDIYWSYHLNRDYVNKYSSLDYDTAHSSDSNKFFCLLESCFLFDIERNKIFLNKLNGKNEVINGANNDQWARIYNKYKDRKILKEGKTCGASYCYSTPDWENINEIVRNSMWNSTLNTWNITKKETTLKNINSIPPQTVMLSQ